MKKNVLILGSGGREHALAHKLKQSDRLAQLFIMPGNPGTAELGMNIPGRPEASDQVLMAIQSYDIDLLICGPEGPLADGLMDAIKQSDLPVKPILVGPSREGAQLESSKAFSKAFMERHGIPTAGYRTFQSKDMAEALAYVESLKPPIVLKASGLAAGKGVIISPDHISAKTELEQLFSGKFGKASETVVIEEFLDGIEFSVFILTNGSQYALLPEAKDYKRIGVGDQGPNTGGMGAVSPVPFAGEAVMQKVKTRIIEPTLEGLSKERIDYQGFIFFGLILVQGEPFVIEYNCRMGDPETEVVMPRLQNDLIELIEAMDEKRLNHIQVIADPRTAVTVMLVSAGYPDAYEKGKAIQLPEQVPGDSVIFHAGTTESEYQLLTNGGRVLAVTSFGRDIDSAAKASMELAETIQFEGKYFRSDIGNDLKRFV
ncbi:MAG TPA: phosphoribosylamine--glycine ligase [Saprospiraceae bacterium]|nr:phosphoribosylamine--glycine ligase [Saprospiraceae bacterium]